MQSNTKKAIIIGETNLCIQCAKLLTSRDWKIIMVSDDPVVITWAKNNSISELPVAQLSTINETNFYLFSIINPYLIPKSFLENKNILLALNYHDSLLPRYAGINSTAWAILNSEKSHGVTLHQITPSIDDGCIAAQSIIDIEKDETAISLNLKCSEQLLLIFKDVIDKIEAGTISLSKQNLDERTYYGAKTIPPNYGVINGIKNLEVLYRLVRGLTLGVGYDNLVATVKVVLDGQFYIVEGFNAELIRDNCTLNDHTILFNTVRDIYGNKTDLGITYKDISIEHTLTNGALTYLSNIKTLERKHKKQILKLLSDPDSSIKVLDHISNEPNRKKYTQEIAVPSHIHTTTTLALVYLVLTRFFHSSNFIVSLYVSDDPAIPQELRGLIENRNFINVNSDILGNGFAYLENHLVQLQKNCLIITKDFGYRYGLQLLTDIAIVVGKVERTDKHKIIIKIEKDKLFIEGDGAYQLQIDSVAESVEAVLSKNIQEDIAAKDLKSISILNDARYQQIVHEWNKTEKDYPKDKTIHKLFEEQALKTPDNIAVVCEDTKLTYQELNSKANQLAHYLLQNHNIKPDDLIALCLDRSEQMLIAILGVLKAGGAYVPLDPNYPDERVGYILEDTKTKVIVTNDAHTNRIQQLTKQKAENTDVVTIDSTETQIKLSRQKGINPTISATSNNLIYVIYTSGTTGNPKGVLVEHRSVANYITYLINYNGLNGTSVGSQYAGFGFDAVVCEIYPILLSGGALYIVPEQNRFDPIKINDLFCRNNITHAFLPTKFAELFFNLQNSSLLTLLVAGEKLEKFTKQQYRVANGYGPTENTVHTTNFEVDKQYKNIPIGKPINNVKCYVVDNNLNILPIGTVGELMIGGECLARGYLNRPDLTAEKFIFNPFRTGEEKSQNRNSRIYKTGDLVRWLHDGNLEYIGRNDSQVKIRGYRIELGEIENKLLSYPNVKQAAALVKERVLEQTNDKYLLAYYVADNKLDEVKMQAYLATQLPEYMLPQMLIHINKLPLTANGKLDKRALPEPEFISSYNYVAPETQLQNQIIKIWSEILSIPKESIGITDGFFNLGGNSILAINLIMKLSKIKECRNIRVVDIFKYTTIEQLTKFVEPNNLDKNIKIAKTKESLETEIAIIAVSGAFSGCENINQYWDLIQKGVEGVKHYTREECIKLGISEEVLANPNFVPTSGHVPNIDKFDTMFWGLAPNEAKSIDPQIRKFLEHCWYVLEGSGYLRNRDEISIGMFAGAGNSGYLVDHQKSDDKSPFSSRDLDHLSAKDILATKTSYLLKLTGTAININTACSTSLTAVIEGCIHLASGYCDMAIAGGVSLLQPEEVGHIYQEGLIYSKDGYCRVFDNKSSGIVHGSGVGVVLLKRLSDAKKDNDNILAVIKGYGINNDGDRKMSYTSPSIIGQKECVINAQNTAGITPELIDYVECHGTGTKLGDPVEIQALDEAFKYNTKQNNPKHKCIIGSVKANIGHADIAAGIAGLIKVCKMLEYKTIPKQINYDTINTELHLGDTNFEIVTETRKWDQTNNAPRMAGVSSFGIGGTNAHVIVSEYIPDNQKENAEVGEITYICSVAQKQSHNYILPLSAKSPGSLEAYKKDFTNYLTNTTKDIKSIAYTLQLKREHFDCRLSVVCSSVADAINKLKIDVGISRANKQKTQNIVFMFPGQGSQYANMSLSLYQHDNDYKATADECIKLANKYTKIQFEKILFPALFNDAEDQNAIDTTDHDINQAKWAQLALFIVEYSLAKLLESLNINATSYIGHSIGEYVAATLSGVFSLEDAIKLVVIRGQLMQSMPKGAMLSILANAAEIEQIIKDNHCEIAVINSPKNCVISGTHESINNLKAALDQLNLATTVLKVSHAYHSHLMVEASREFTSQFKQIKHNKPQKRFISNVTGNFITDAEVVNPEYWANHMRNPVLFSDGIKTLFDSYNNLLFIEVGPGKSSVSFVKQHDMGKPNIVQLLNYRKDNIEGIQDVCIKEDILNKLWMGGYNIDFNNYYYYKNHAKVVRLPNYHFDNASCWINQLRNTPIDTVAISTLLTPKMDSSTLIFDGVDIKTMVVEQDQSDKHYEIAKVFLDVLGVEKISIHDDFFALGGDSLLAVSVVAKLQGVNVVDVFKFRTIAKIVEFAKSAISTQEGGLQQRLQQVKLLYSSEKTARLMQDEVDMLVKKVSYLQKICSLVLKKQKKEIRSVLLTGATGHVGCNILYQLLHETSYKIYLLVRSSSNEEANRKVNYKFRYYFDVGLGAYKDRVKVIVSDIEKPNLGLSTAQYQELIADVDSIIHSAAIVKQHGDYSKFYKANVQATVNLLELSRQTNGKDFHYISTIGVLVNGYIPNRGYYIFDEEDNAGILLERNNVYARTKYEGELIVNKYREYGITSSIYRLGNVAMHSTNHRHQTNIEDNAFFVIAKTIQNLGVTTNEVDEVEISPVDHTALAIVKLFDQVQLSNMTHHVFNPYFCRFNQLFVTEQGAPIKMCSVGDFIDTILEKLNKDIISNKQVELFMLHKKWLQKIDVNNFTQVELLQDRTCAILAQMGFYWSEVTRDMWTDVIKQARDL